MITRYIPENSEHQTRAGLPLDVYTYTNKNGQPAAIAYKAKAVKPLWHYRFLTEEQRTRRIDSAFDAVAANEDHKNTRKAARLSFVHGYQPGDILYSSWGYDQTNVEFYQVIATTAKTVTFREVMQNRSYDSVHMSGTCSPRPGEFMPNAKTYTRTVTAGSRESSPKGAVNFADYPGGYMRRLWQYDGRPKGYSDYA